MTSAEDCEDYARECAILAGLTKDKTIRDQMLKMASQAAKERFASIVGLLASSYRDLRLTHRRAAR